MNLETINKWLENEFGVSYTRLEELHDWLVEENMKLKDKNQQLKKQKDDGVKYIKKHIKYECDDTFNGMQFYSYHLYDFNKEELLRMLGEIDE